MAITGVTTFLWFDEQASQAADLYVSLFPDSRILGVSHYQEGAQKPAGTVLVVDFELFGQRFSALNAGPEYPHSPAVSFQVHCDTQEEVDRIWFGLIEGGGAEGRCGWCTDRFGVSWQVIPNLLGELLSSPEQGISHGAWTAMMSMGRIDMAGLREATGRSLS